VKAKPGQTEEEFKKRWLDGHSKFAASWENIKGYQVNLPIPDIHEKANQGRLFDGIGILTWDTYEDMMADFDSDRGKAGFADASEFMEIAMNIYCEEHIIK
jgi:hypothetical protein